MDIAAVLRVLFYLWLGLALGVYAYRLYQRFSRVDDPTTSDLVDGGAAAGDSTSGRTGRKTTGPSKLPASVGRPPGDDRDRPLGSATTDRGTADDGDLVRSVIRDELDKRRAEADTETPVAADGDDAAPSDTSSQPDTKPVSTSVSIPAPLRQPVADSLTGIALPCDLAPTSEASRTDDPYRVAFATTGFSSRVISAQIADELERLGFTVKPGAGHGLTAARDGHEVRVEIVEDAATVNRDGNRLFPHVPGGSTAVVFHS